MPALVPGTTPSSVPPSKPPARNKSFSLVSRLMSAPPSFHSLYAQLGTPSSPTSKRLAPLRSSYVTLPTTKWRAPVSRCIAYLQSFAIGKNSPVQSTRCLPKSSQPRCPTSGGSAVASLRSARGTSPYAETLLTIYSMSAPHCYPMLPLLVFPHVQRLVDVS
jgi:hypothetical protein